ASRPSAELRRELTTPALRSSRRWYETRFCGLPISAVSSPTRRSLRDSSWSRRHRWGSAMRPRISGGWVVTSTRPLLHQSGLVYRRRGRGPTRHPTEPRRRGGELGQEAGLLGGELVGADDAPLVQRRELLQLVGDAGRAPRGLADVRVDRLLLRRRRLDVALGHAATVHEEVAER